MAMIYYGTNVSRACIFCRGRTFLDEIQHVPLIACEQCDRRAHHSCLNTVGLQEDPSRGWFCTSRCATLNFLLREQMLNSPIKINIPVLHKQRYDYLTWSLLDVTNDTQQAKIQETIEVLGTTFSKEVAQRVVKGLDPYRGLYTAIAESQGRVVSVTTFRLHDHIAEIAFVTTVLLRRRQRICERLMEALENFLKVLGVEEIVLHSTSRALPIWTNTFGYERVPSSRSFEDYNILQFESTITCRKFII
ncbi:hypothetical protein TSUD_306940 [Trifolium subterraneum]|uniref:N-acetyltransferase domain-containing protein n=1 Tax=Trifolium subterraneum TaxID=3900 RepID=A0A2Z6NB99_TRISU|nr:hypothetical protein TSUD_306940 [Trifolium subterraneum]